MRYIRPNTTYRHIVDCIIEKTMGRLRVKLFLLWAGIVGLFFLCLWLVWLGATWTLNS